MEKKIVSILFVAGAMILAIIFILISSIRDLTSLENILLQFLILSLGLVGSYIWGRQSAKDAAKELIRPHARSAFRRVLSLYGSLSRLAYAIERARSTNHNDQVNVVVLDTLEAIVTEQIVTVNDALMDWRDIVPAEEITEDVNELRWQRGDGEYFNE